MNNKLHINRRNLSGFSIIELMIAVLIGLILVAGLISVFDTTSRMNRTQNGLARLQENGRYAILQLKQNIEQAGYQYCLGSSLDVVGTNDGVNVQPLVVFTNTLSPGMPTRADVNQLPVPAAAPSPYLIDPAYFLHGHECTVGSGCLPDTSSVGTPTPSSIPIIGIGDGERLDGTDVLSFRYYSGVSREIRSIGTSSGDVTINFSNRSIASGEDITAVGDQVIIASCTGPSRVVSLTASSATQATAQIDPGFNINASPSDMAKMFDLETGINAMTYYVANQVVDGRSIPTLFSVLNGTTNAIVQGVDRFDVLYGVRLASGAIRMLDANGVENLPIANCVGNPSLGVLISLNNITGCGWRSVASIEIHLLLNTIYDSSFSANEQFVYSIDGNTHQIQSDLDTGIAHYNMFRREFMTSITLKNF